ncbi:hypothetical protein D3C77_356030 [compost metagenome]
MIEIIAIFGQNVRTFGMNQIAQQAAIVFTQKLSPRLLHDDSVLLIREQRVDLFRPNAQQGTQFSRISPQRNNVVLIDDAAEEGRDERAASCYEILRFFGKARFDHIHHRSDNEIILAEVFFHTDHIGLNV